MQPTTQNNGYDLLTLDGNMDLPGGKRGAYDFFIRDYQSNVRMILTEETHLGSNSCTMETQRAANEEPLFGQVDASGTPSSDNEVKARFAVSSIPGQASGNGWQNSTIGSHVSRIGNLAGKQVGPNTLLKVMAGDEVSATTIYYYQNPVTNQSGGTSVLTNLLVSLAQAISGSGVTSGLTKTAASAITSQLSSSVPFSTLTNPDAANASGNNPKAYLSVMFFDERFRFVEEGSATVRVSQAGSGAPALVLAGIKAPKNGYAYVYVSNVSDDMVYFDNLQVAHNRGRIIEENHYYAYGLKIAGISSRKLSDPNEGRIKNTDLYNDKELIEDAELNWYDYGFRNYDPQIGRFPQLDPLTDEYPELTPYQYASNDPITNIDLDGLEGVNGVKLMEEVFVIGHRTASTGLRLSAQTLSLSAIKLAGAVVKSQILTSKLHQGLATKAVQDNLSMVTEEFYNINKNQMTYADYLSLGAEVNTYFKGLNLMAWWKKTDFQQLDRSVISNETGNVSDINRILLTQGRINEIASEVPNMLAQHVEIPLALAYRALDPFVGMAPKGSMLKFKTLPVITDAASKLSTELKPTLGRISSGGRFPHRNDGSIFRNREGVLPQKEVGYYREYVHPTPGVTGSGARRIIKGSAGEIWYTADHYRTFIRIK